MFCAATVWAASTIQKPATNEKQRQTQLLLIDCRLIDFRLFPNTGASSAHEHVFHMQRGLVRDVEKVAAIVRRAQMDDHHEVGRLLDHLDAERPHLFGQPRRGDRNSVLH